METTASAITQELGQASFEDIPQLLRAYSSDTRKQVQAACNRAQRRYNKEARERERVQRMYDYQLQIGGSGIVCGVDEVGRGAVAGPLTVCAMVLGDEPIWGINDSKQLSPARRKELSEIIRFEARAFYVAHIEPNMIDELGMGACLKAAFAQAIDGLGLTLDCVLVDGNSLHIHEREKNVVKGDGRIAAIAAASIVAKVERDELMVELSRAYPEYGFDSCKGYASSDHVAAIRRYGLCPLHRRSFCENFVDG